VFECVSVSLSLLYIYIFLKGRGSWRAEKYASSKMLPISYAARPSQTNRRGSGGSTRPYTIVLNQCSADESNNQKGKSTQRENTISFHQSTTSNPAPRCLRPSNSIQTCNNLIFAALFSSVCKCVNTRELLHRRFDCFRTIVFFFYKWSATSTHKNYPKSINCF
jgi:hypothetical protein